VRRNVLCLFAFVGLLFRPLAAGAQQTPELNEVVVTATRIESPIIESPSAISVISSADLAAPGARDLSVVIAGQAGTIVNDYGPIGATKSVSLRGSTSDQVLVLLDGVRLNSGRVSSVDLSTIPLEIIDRVEILRGEASTIYGSGAIGGVINIITKKADRPQITASVTNGSFLPHAANSVSADYSTYPYTYTVAPAVSSLLDLVDTQQVQLSMAGKLGDAGLIGGGSLTRSANGFTWYDPSQINGWRRRTNADLLSGNANLGLDVPFFGGSLTAKTFFDTSNTGTPGSVYYPSAAGRQYDNSAAGILGWKADRFLRDDLSLDVKASYKYDDLQFNDPAFPPASDHRTQTAGLDVTQRFAAFDTVSFIYGGGASYDYVDSTNYSGPKDRLNLSGFLSAPVTLAEGLTVTPSARYDYFSDFIGSFSFSLSGVLLLSDQSSLRAAVASAYRVPALNDLYWYDPLGPSDPYGYSTGNPALRPETSYSSEVGWSMITPRISIDASVFTRFVLDNIVWLYDASMNPPYGAYLPENLTKALYPGAEIHAKVSIFGPLSIEGSYTFDYSFLLNDGTTELSLADNRRVPYAPVHSASLALRWNGEVFAAGIEGQYVSDKYTDRPNTSAWMIHGYFVANADLKYRVSDQVTLTLAGKNLLNTLYYTQSGINSAGSPLDPGYPMPPFSIEAGMQLHM
jgi:vitamin B12 transporter